MKKLAILSLVLAAGAAMAAEPGSYDPMTSTGAASRASVQAQVTPSARTQAGEVGPVAASVTTGMSRDTSAVRAEGRLATRAHQTIGEVGAV